ncbi:hypothetical protein TYRP_009951 [Tyrophagus putrescentiae]|nr:hypothetical protein TYRP_009951 [Tyrophagus putrescentiae]
MAMGNSGLSTSSFSSFITSEQEAESRPVVGSSRISMFGDWKSSTQMESRFCWPPEQRATRVWRIGSMPNILISLLTRVSWSKLARPMFCSRAAKVIVSTTVSVAISPTGTHYGGHLAAGKVTIDIKENLLVDHFAAPISGALKGLHLVVDVSPDDLKLLWILNRQHLFSAGGFGSLAFIAITVAITFTAFINTFRIFTGWLPSFFILLFSVIENRQGEKRVQREDYITHYLDQAPIDMEMRRYKTKARTKAAAAAIIRNAGQHCIEQRQMKKKKKKTVPDRTRQNRAEQSRAEQIRRKRRH